MENKDKAPAPDLKDAWDDEAWAAEQRALVQYEIDNPRYDPQVQPDGSYRDDGAERRSKLKPPSP